MKKIKKIGCIILVIVLMLNMFSVSAAASVTLNASTVAAAFNAKKDTSYPDGSCLAFVSDVFESLGVGRAGICCAYKYGSTYIRSTSSTDIPIGADVYFGNCGGGPCGVCGSAYYGHIGVYVGDGYFVHATGGKVRKSLLSEWQSKYRGWGYHGNANIVQDSTGGGGNNTGTTASIDSVSVASASSSHITINFSCSSATKLARVIVTSVQSGESITTDYTSGLGGISHTFNTSSMMNPGKTFQIYIYGYTSTTGGGETLHRVTYNADAGYVTLPDSATTAEITSVSVASASSSHITLNFSCSSGTKLARVIVTSVATGESITTDYTSGLSGITYTFNKSSMTNPGQTFQIYIYGYISTTGGGETLHRVTYNAEAGYVTLPGSEDRPPVAIAEAAGGGEQIVLVKGWAFDYDNVDASIAVHIYVGGTFCGSVTANQYREDINLKYPGVGNYHGFEDALVVDSSLVGEQEVEMYALNTDPSGTNPSLGKFTVTIEEDKTAPIISNVKVTNITPDGYTVTCTAVDGIEVDRVQFPTWTIKNGQDDLFSKWETNSAASGTKNGNTYTYKVRISDHNNESGRYVTHIYAYDKNENSVCHTIAVITVPVAVDSISLDKNELTFTGTGGTETLTAAISPSDATDKTVVWTTSDASVATVDNGVVTAVGYGTAVITATASNGSSAVCNVTVNKPENPFVDVQEGQYYYEPILWAVESEITSGLSATEFAPEVNCTRGQVVTFLWRAAGQPEASISNPFNDIYTGAYYYDAVLWAVENGITSGLTATEFAPEANCTRGQVVCFLCRAAGNPTSTIANPFEDVVSGAYYYGPVLWAVENGITSGLTATEFAPDANCTRGQVVTFLYRNND